MLFPHQKCPRRSGRKDLLREPALPSNRAGHSREDSDVDEASLQPLQPCCRCCGHLFYEGARRHSAFCRCPQTARALATAPRPMRQVLHTQEAGLPAECDQRICWGFHSHACS